MKKLIVALTGVLVSVALSAGAADAWAVKPFRGQTMYFYGFGAEAFEIRAFEALKDRAMFRNVWFRLSGDLYAGDLGFGAGEKANAIVRIGESCAKDLVWKGKRPVRITDLLETTEWKDRWEYCHQFMNDSPTTLLSFDLAGFHPAFLLPETSDMHRDDFVIWTWDNPRFVGFSAFDGYDADVRAFPQWLKATADPAVRARLEREYPLDAACGVRDWTDRNFSKLKSCCFRAGELLGSFSSASMTGHDLARVGVKYLRYEDAPNGAGWTGCGNGAFVRGASRQFDVPFGWSVTDAGTLTEKKLSLAYGAFVGASSLGLEHVRRRLYELTRLTSFGEACDRIFTWALTSDRGASYTPVALLTSLDATDAGAGLASEVDLTDVIAADAGQDAEKLFSVLSNYKAILLVGRFDARRFDASVLARYVKNGGRLFRTADAEAVPGAQTVSDVRGTLAQLRDEWMPIAVAGDVQWGVHRTKAGWTAWFINRRKTATSVTATCRTTGEKRTVTIAPKDWMTVAFVDAPTVPKAHEIALTDWQFSHDRVTWKDVEVPHDWAIGEPFDVNVDAQDVAVLEDGENKVSRRIGRTGALPWIGEGWYRRHLKIPEVVREAELWFDGAMANAEIFANGEPIGGWRYGYTPFVVKLPKAKEIDLLVHLQTMPQSSRWYPGAGLYRKVTLRLDPQYRVEDVFVRTEKIEGGKAYMRVSGPNGDRTFVVDKPRLWTPEDPYLYTLEPEGIRYGIRTVEWKDGTFRLNGKVRKFRGVCLHHDLGPIGTAFNPAAFRRQVRLLKDIGCDAIRTAHNIPCSEQMDICDEMGMMVMAESFDEWKSRKCRYGYHDDFTDWWRADLEALVRFHRNHPSIVMWSIGNEIPDQRSELGTQISRAMVGLLHWFDPTRPVTQGHSSMPYAIEAGGVQEMDIPGVTYRLRFYDQLHAASKYGGVLGAETASTESSRGWYAFPDEACCNREHLESMQSSSYDLECGSWSNLPDDDFATQDDHPWTLGEFVWTGFDYLGEPDPYETRRSRSSYFGIYDLAGLPKDRAYLYRARWRTDEPTLHVLPHWTWPDRVGKVTPVYVYTSYPAAEIFVNGKSQGRKTFDRATRLDRYRLRWRDVVYEPGELKVVAYGKDGRVAATKIVRTTGEPHHLVLTPDRTQLTGARDLAFITVDVVDKDGNLCPRATNRVNFTVSGAGHFKAACNGDATDLDTLSQPTMRAFNGRLVVVVAAEDKDGTISISAESAGLLTASAEVKVKKEVISKPLWIWGGKMPPLRRCGILPHPDGRF